MKKKIAVIANFCDYTEKTNNRFNYICECLCEQGFNVELVTSSFSHKNKCQREKIDTLDKKYQTTLVYEPSYKKNISLKRLLFSHRMLGKNIYRYMLKNEQKPVLVYCAVPSISVALAASKYAKKNGIPFVIDVQDLWPEAFQMVIKSSFVGKMLFMPFRIMVNNVYKSADYVISVSQKYLDRAISSNKIANGSVVFLGTDLDVFDKNVKDYKFKVAEKDTLWMGYCGSLEASYDIMSVLEALKGIKDSVSQKIKFVIMGDGKKKRELEEYTKNNSLDVLFTGLLPYEEVCAWLSVCDFVINPIVPGSAASIINKHGDYVAAGKAVINTQESKEYRDLVTKYNMGINCKNGDISELKDAILYFMENNENRVEMGKNARKCAEELFDRKVTYQTICRQIGYIVSREKNE